MADAPKSPSLSRNPISAIGAVIAFVALTNTAFLIYIDGRQAHANPYLGILAWLIAPSIFSFRRLASVWAAASCWRRSLFSAT